MWDPKNHPYLNTFLAPKSRYICDLRGKASWNRWFIDRSVHLQTGIGRRWPQRFNNPIHLKTRKTWIVSKWSTTNANELSSVSNSMDKHCILKKVHLYAGIGMWKAAHCFETLTGLQGAQWFVRVFQVTCRGHATYLNNWHPASAAICNTSATGSAVSVAWPFGQSSLAIYLPGSHWLFFRLKLSLIFSGSCFLIPRCCGELVGLTSGPWSFSYAWMLRYSPIHWELSPNASSSSISGYQSEPWSLRSLISSSDPSWIESSIPLSCACRMMLSRSPGALVWTTMTGTGFSRISLWMATWSVRTSLLSCCRCPSAMADCSCSLAFPASSLSSLSPWTIASSHTVWMAFSVSFTLSWITACSCLLLRQILLIN